MIRGEFEISSLMGHPIILERYRELEISMATERMDSDIDQLWGENIFRTVMQFLLFAFMFPFIRAKRYLGMSCFIWNKSGNTST